MIIQPGSLINQRYRVDSVIADGGMGRVYRAEELQSRRACAIKHNLDATPEAQQLFQSHSALLRSLRHENLAQLSDCFVDADGQQFQVMEFIPGENLDHYVQRRGPLSERKALAYMAGILDAVAYCHSQGVIHRDIKPANLIKRKGRDEVILVDFGIAQPSGRPPARIARAGTLGYAAPEQFYGTVGPAADVYSLGATLYFLLTGQHPPDSRQIRHGQAQLIPPRQLRRGISPKLEQAILAAMALDPGARIPTVAQLQQALGLRPGRRPYAGPPEWSLALAGAILLILLILAGVVTARQIVDGDITRLGKAAPGGGLVIATDATTPAPEPADPAVTTSPSAIALETVSSSLTVVVVSPAGMSTRQPTSTPAPATSTPTARPTAAEEIALPVSPAPNRPASLAAAPQLLAPANSERAAEQVILAWRSEAEPTPEQTFRIFLRTEQGGQQEREWTFDTRQQSYTFVYDGLPGVFRIPGTVYYWRVALVWQADGALASEQSAERSFVFQRND